MAKARSSPLLASAAAMGNAEFCATRRTRLSVAARGSRRRRTTVARTANSADANSQPATSPGEPASHVARAAQYLSKMAITAAGEDAYGPCRAGGRAASATRPEAREVHQEPHANARGSLVREVRRQLAPAPLGPGGARDVQGQPRLALHKRREEPGRPDRPPGPPPRGPPNRHRAPDALVPPGP